MPANFSVSLVHRVIYHLRFSFPDIFVQAQLNDDDDTWFAVADVLLCSSGFFFVGLDY